ncbi:TRPM8 channel-associated factor 3-like [Ochotona princeps]|uniref:TRPM8 channel-associated factor 3-like n=1 Tax=Ochotona princeps TaxID=9978 RepID=UPI002714F85C|nr:TRPM8 channel-associated factor 3-like [Ochotona princeps]
MATTHDADFQALVKGVTAWNTPPDLPSELLLTREAAFPVLVNEEGQVVIAASSYYQGRLVVMGHEEYLMHPPLAPFLVNAVRWLCSTPGAAIGVHPSLNPLVKILQDAGIEVKVQEEPNGSLGAYCLDPYYYITPEKMIQFVERGGGLLIGSRDLDWASTVGNDTFLFEFSGNQMTSVAGVHITNSTVLRHQWVVSQTVPTIPLHITCQDNVTKDQQQLLQGITELDFSTGGIPSQLLVHGPLAFPLGFDSSLNCFLAAARYGQGRVVLCGHEGMITNDRMDKFMINALHWLKGHQKGKIAVNSRVKNLGLLLAKTNLQWIITDINFLTSDLSVYCCSSLDNMDVKKVVDFVARGGGVLIGSQAWYWGIRNPSSNCMAQYPNNKFLKHVGLGILREKGNRGCFPVPKPEILNYHVRKALSQFESMLFDNGKFLEDNWLEQLKKDCSYMLQIPHDGIPIYESVHKNILRIIQKGLPVVQKKNSIIRGGLEAILKYLAEGLVKAGTASSVLLNEFSSPPATGSPVSIEISTENRDSWVSTGLYLPAGRFAVVTLPKEAVAAQLQVQVGCHTDDISDASIYYRPPVVTRRYILNETKTSIAWHWGGLLYILVPRNYNLGTVLVTISGAAPAPYFKLGKTSQEEWRRCLQGNPAPWGELATDNIILTVPTEKLKAVTNPDSLLRLWDEMMQAAAKLAAKPFPYRRPERIVIDVQNTLGLMHEGYPIMGQMQILPRLIDETAIRSSGVWGAIHEVGHNFQQPAWKFHPHSTEADCNLWSVYVHEEVLKIPRERAHSSLKPESRRERIKLHLGMGAPLSNWNTWTALETYLQLQEAFGWDPFIKLFAVYQTLSKYPQDNPGKMNLWMEKFSEIVQKNLVPFFKAWGWPIQKQVADGLAHLPEWQENPMKAYIP